MKDVGSKATPEVVGTWLEVGRLFQALSGDRRERLQQVADRLGISYKVARRRLCNYEAMAKADIPTGETAGAPVADTGPPQRSPTRAGQRQGASNETSLRRIRVIKKGVKK